MARPREYDDRVRITVDVERALLDQIEAEAEARDLSRNRVITITLERGLLSLTPIGGLIPDG